ncbi:hypothetical protein N9N28_04380 [Rubripirellula amarantea]|nr:hypothetical protein [Rubripirellula amarantea]
MNNQATLKMATLGMFALVAGMLGWSLMQQEQSHSTAHADATSSQSKVKPTPISDLSLGNFGDGISQSDESDTNKTTKVDSPELILKVGKIGSTPDRQEVTTISHLPYTGTEIRRIYTASADRACRMLVPGSPVVPARTGARPGRVGTYGRIPTFTIGLTLGSEGIDKLPTVTRTQVEKYLRKHRLSVQPILFHDESGHLYFGTDCQTAFFELDRPGVTVDAEPMIETAVQRFRALGIVGDGSSARISSPGGMQETNTVLGRTLAMAFTFEKAEGLLALTSTKPKVTTELLLLHLPAESTVDNPDVRVFITSDDRQTLHRLDVSNERLHSPIPTISAEIRFAKTVLMGMYPAGPIVTGIRFRSEGVVPMEAVLQMTRASKETGASPMSVTEILDQFGDLSQQLPTEFTDRSKRQSGQRPSMIENRLDRLMQQRSNSRTGSPNQSTGSEVNEERSPTKVKMMTGLGK